MARSSDRSALGVPLFDDERSDIVPGFLVVFGVGAVTVRELEGRRREFRRKQVQDLCTLINRAVTEP